MRETPSAFNEQIVLPEYDREERYPAENLSKYSYHTGASLRPLGQDELCPVLFRDIGPVAMAIYLRGELKRLAGPLSPIIYMRTESYSEPYTDYEEIGRLIFLRPLLLHPWHSGIPTIFVARATRTAPVRTIGFVPGTISLTSIAHEASLMKDHLELREALGGRLYDEIVTETMERLDRLSLELEQSEKLTGPLRMKFKSSVTDERDQAREEMERLGLDENDLCTAWHHISRERRQYIMEKLR